MTAGLAVRKPSPAECEHSEQQQKIDRQTKLLLEDFLKNEAGFLALTQAERADCEVIHNICEDYLEQSIRCSHFIQHHVLILQPACLAAAWRPELVRQAFDTMARCVEVTADRLPIKERICLIDGQAVRPLPTPNRPKSSYEAGEISTCGRRQRYASLR